MIKTLFIAAVLFYSTAVFAQQKSADTISWGQKILVQDQPVFNDQPGGAVAASTGFRKHGIYGSEYARLLKLQDGSWLAGYTISTNNGYKNDPKGGLELQVSRSTDDCRTWQPVSTIADEGRDLDNAQLIQLKNGAILLACRSVRWQESYVLPVYQSVDKGKSWKRLGIIDQTHGKPGELGKPDKGIYEPHMYFLNDGRLAVMYANEKHVVETPSYSQIISEKVSTDGGKTWGPEIWVAHTPGQSASRPGMPVWTKMKDGRYITVYEVCGPEACNIYFKTSADGEKWPEGLGMRIPDQLGGPYILALKSGKLIVTSNSSNVSQSDDQGATWKTVNAAWARSQWPSLYEVRPNEVGAVNSVNRPQGGHNVQIRLGEVK